MLSERDVKALVVMRVTAAWESSNEQYICRVMGQIQALTAVLTGRPCQTGERRASVIYALCGIPYMLLEDGTLEIDDDTLRELGLSCDEADDSICRPGDERFGDSVYW